MTRKFFLIAGVAGLALASPAFGERGGNRDRDGRAQASQNSDEPKAQRAERPQRAERQRAERPQKAERQRAERPQRAERQRDQRVERPQRIERQRVERAERPQRIERQRVEQAERQRIERQRVERAERPQRIERQRVQQAERSQRVERQRIERAERPQRIERQRVQRAERPQRIERLNRRQAFREVNTNFESRRELRDDRRDFRERVAVDSPRRVAALFRDQSMRPMTFQGDSRIVAVGDPINPARYSNFVPTMYRSRYYDTQDYYYRYDDDLGYLYRIDRDDNFVQALIPLFGGYGVGDPWPTTYYSSYVPQAYQPYYYDTPDYYYRSDGYGIYRIDAGTQLITALVALLTGQGYGVGQMLPASYGAYNVPLAYRANYYDRNDALYRYGDGYIYQVDPYSRRIAQRYPIYGNEYDYLIGEPWPVAYPGYNVPAGYQSLYYDTPDNHYRYANGGIYRVDPTSQVILALAALVSGQQFAVGQPLPAGYSAYNVPFDYRDRYYDNNDAWYRYANGYVYQVNPLTGLVEELIPIYA